MTLTVRPPSPAPAGVDLLSRHMWWILTAASVAWSVNYLRTPVTSWHFFDAAARAALAVGDPHGGWHLYHYHPDFQFGPVTIIAALPFTLLPLAVAKYVAAGVMTGAGLLVIRGMAALVPRVERWRVLMVGLIATAAWAALAAGMGHLDDVIALTATVWAMVAIRRDHAFMAALLLAVAADAKPWALAFVPLLLALRHRRVGAIAVWCSGIVLAWLPFFIADASTLAVASFSLPVSPSSVLRLFDAQVAATPWWCRPVQLVGGATLGVVLWRCNRLVGVVAVVLSLRLATDPATWAYYAAGLVVGAALLDLARAVRGPDLPWLTMLAVVAVLVPTSVHTGPLGDPAVRATLRLVCCAVVMAVAVTGRYRNLLRLPVDDPGHPASSPRSLR